MHILLAGEKDRRHRQKVRYDWARHARAEQKEPIGTWKVWLILAGRGFGKTRTGAETIRAWVTSKRAKRIALVGSSLDDARKVMVEGESGLLSVCPPDMRPVFYPSLGSVVWPCGATATLYSASHYDKLRGPQFDGAWVDELAKFDHAEATFDQLMLGLRLGESPRVIVTTTPQPLPFLKQLSQDKDTVVTRGSTFDNRKNLSLSYLKVLERRYGGTRLGRQEIDGQFVDDDAGALWTPSMLEASRWPMGKVQPKYVFTVVAVDPSVTANAKSDETGIVVAAVDASGHFYVLDDVSGRMDALDWARCAVEAHKHHGADAVVAEVNNGGDLVARMIQGVDASVFVRPVRALRSKWQRAQPVAALYQQGRVYHVRNFNTLEEQMLSYTPSASSSPDRLDALVWALTELSREKRPEIPSPTVWIS
jgi:phage terminase large subunit-like protein